MSIVGFFDIQGDQAVGMPGQHSRAFCWRTQAKEWAAQEGGEHAGIVLASGAGALGVLLGGPIPVVGAEPDERPELGLGDLPEADLLPSAVGLIWRALVLWLVLMLLLTLANWAP